MKEVIVALTEEDKNIFLSNNKYATEQTVQSSHFESLCGEEFRLKIQGLAKDKPKINLFVKLIVQSRELLKMSDIATFNETIEALEKDGYLGELSWGIEVDSDEFDNDLLPYRLYCLVGWNDPEIEFSEDGTSVKLKGEEYEMSVMNNFNGIVYSSGHVKGQTYNFGVIDHTNKKAILPFVFNHVSLSVDTVPCLATVNYHGRWYVLELNNLDFNIEEIESLSIVDSSRYTLIDGYSNGLARVRIGELWGIINTRGEEVVPVEYQNIWNFYGKGRVSTSAEKNGEIETILFKNITDKDSIPLERLPYVPKLSMVGLTNFRKIQTHNEIDFGEINFFVGPNNVGKSTSIKGLILLSWNLNHMHFDGSLRAGLSTIPFSFAPQEYPELNLGSYSHAVNRANKGQSIVLSCAIGHCVHEMIVNSDSNIEKLSVSFKRTPLRIELDSHSVRMSGITNSSEVCIAEYNIEDNKDLRLDLCGSDLFGTLIDGFSKFASLDKQYLSTLSLVKKDIIDSISGLKCIIHIPVYSASRNAIINRYDQNDLTARVCASYSDLSLSGKEIVRNFLLKWMNSDPDHFDFGQDFRIETIKGRNTLLTVEIQGKDGEWEDLCDLGTGANHLFVLLLYIGCLIEKYAANTDVRPIITIEEPEMNLHPKFQSMLANMLCDANKYVREVAAQRLADSYKVDEGSLNQLGFQFVVETHSEYIVRKSQVLARNLFREYADQNKCCPLKTYYFPSEGAPYDMMYQKNGKFGSKFQPGFYDIADDLIIDLI